MCSQLRLCDLDLDLDLVDLILDLDLHVLQMYPRTKNEVLGQGFQRPTDATAFAGGK